MISLLQLLAIAVSALLLLVVLELVRRRRLTEEHSFIWILCAVALLGLALWRDSLDRVAEWLGIFYPPIVLVLVLTVFVFLALLYFSVVISRQREQIEQLTVEVALLRARERDANADPPDESDDRG